MRGGSQGHRRLLLIGRLDEAGAYARRSRPSTPLPPVSRTVHELDARGNRDAPRLRAKAARRRSLAPGASPRKRRHPCADGGEVDSRIRNSRTPPLRVLMTRGAERPSCSMKSKHYCRRKHSSWTLAVMSCVRKAGWFRSQNVRYCSRSHALWARRGRETCPETRSSRAHSA